MLIPWLFVQEFWGVVQNFTSNEDFRVIPWRRKWQPTTVFLPGESYGQKSRVGYKLWGCKRAAHDCTTQQQQQHSDIKAGGVWHLWGNQVSRVSWLATAPETQNSQTNNLQVTCQKRKCWWITDLQWFKLGKLLLCWFGRYVPGLVCALIYHSKPAHISTKPCQLLWILT